MASKKTEKLMQALHDAIKKSHVADVKTILTENPSISNQICTTEMPKCGTSLHAACAWGDLEVVKLIVELGLVDVNIRHSEGDLGTLGRTALHEACAYGHGDIVNFLLSHGANQNVTEAGGLTPLHSACQGKNVKIIQALLKAGAKLNVKDVKQETPLHASILRSPMEITMCLIGAGCDVHALDQEHQSALHYAAEWGHEALIEVLIRKGASVNQQDSEGRTPMHVTDESDIRDLLIKHGADPSIRDKKGRPGIEGQLDMQSEENKKIDHCLQKHLLLGEKREIKCNAEVAEAMQQKYNKLAIVGDSDVKSAKGNVMAELLSKTNVAGE